ncbi:CcoQ/FixQ family Cbb3-type cytochrome c oxidase assembly chaperone [Flavobacterium salilacus subsp. salilacus]|uniref:CcoQ/FixQ family Cbb3-type cytochrome c oxidase assembly chaperone n=1 Tax=Flavobacterium TaxID=237 RepID=UPI001074CE79|nr:MULTISPECIES: CcoQ/FixQ family Cbb3-type cytochrome c oxidase assembly chaperone [Flavobacterium]KAF2519115.1 CcoQ/FixQ family Cbb3-type cytochrome c oxidase assembly chaperone [Flavobacterium salilacus subsp. salilacus]MBE1613293.1 CcoQ/FixQ family Cbb3-type cytochrome c oxidase assembly chaperone [Flavobacterium sp. SaA2.13]
MLKFVKHNMDTISGIEIYPIISLLIFFIFFVGLYTWVFTYKKEKISEMSHLPFSDEGDDNQTFNY